MVLFAAGALSLIALALALLWPAGRTAAAVPAAARPPERARAGDVSSRPADETEAVETRAGAARSRQTLVALCLAIPIFTVALYAWIGSPGAAALQPSASAGASASGQRAAATGGTAAPRTEVAPEVLQAMLATMAERLEKSPGNPATDLEGWTLLGRSYAALQRFGDADRAYVRALALAPDDAQLLADRADVLTMLQGGRSTGEPERLIERALRIAPTNPKVLALGGGVALEHNDFAGARRLWQQARDLAQPGSEFAADLDRSLAGLAGAGTASGGSDATPGAGRAQAANNGSSGNPSNDATTGTSPGQPPGPALAGAREPPPSTLPTARITGRVSLSPSLAARAAPGDTVFIFARAAEGPRMPLAILRTTVAELPRDFALDDSLAMSPQLKLSAFPRVVVGVRVSHSGNATPQPGDLRGESAPTGTRVADLRLVIDQVQR